MSVTRYTSEYLYHFVGFGRPNEDSANFETLAKIIRSRKIIYKGFDAAAIGMDYSIDLSVDIAKGEDILQAVTCYGDIPREALEIHIKKYGKVGIGFKRSFLVGKGARPVIYMPVKLKDYWNGFGPNRGKLALQSWLNAWDAFYEYCVVPADGQREVTYVYDRPRDAYEAILRMESLMTKDFLPFLKAFNPDLPDDDIDNFYMEREWRLIGKLSFVLDNIAEIVLPSKFTNEFIAAFPQLADRHVTIEKLFE